METMASNERFRESECVHVHLAEGQPMPLGGAALLRLANGRRRIVDSDE